MEMEKEHSKITRSDIIFKIIVPIGLAIFTWFLGTYFGSSNSIIYYNGSKVTTEEFKLLVSDKDELAKENINLTSKIAALQDENARLKDDYQTIENQYKNVQFSDRSLTINGNPTNFTGQVVGIEGKEYYSEEFIKYLSANNNLTSVNNEVNIGAIPTTTQMNLLSVTKPYNTINQPKEVVFNMDGVTYDNGLQFLGCGNGEMSFRLDKKYKTLLFDFGHVDDSGFYEDFTLSILIDSEKVKTIKVSSRDLVKSFEIDINYADILTFSWNSPTSLQYSNYGMANIKVQ